MALHGAASGANGRSPKGCGAVERAKVAEMNWLGRIDAAAPSELAS